MTIGEHYLQDARLQMAKLRQLAEGAIAQVDDAQLMQAPHVDGNSIALTMKHLAGNMRSRWTDFLTTDGEKPDRQRDAEFELRPDDTPETLRAAWDRGWKAVTAALEPLGPDDLLTQVTIRGEAHTVMQAIDRQLTHYAYHVGQIVQLARGHAGAQWTSLSIPRGASASVEVGKTGAPYLAGPDDHSSEA